MGIFNIYNPTYCEENNTEKINCMLDKLLT